MTAEMNAGLNVKAMLRGLAVDVGLPVVGYYGLTALGFSDWAALTTATVVAALLVLWGVVRDRTLNPFAMVMLIVFGLGLVLSFLTGDARFLLVMKSLVTATIGIVFLVSAVIGRRPLTLAAQQKWSPESAESLAEEYRTDPDVRRGHRFLSAVWGVGLIAEALVRAVIVYLLPLDIAVGASTALLVVTIVGLMFWTTRWVARAQA